MIILLINFAVPRNKFCSIKVRDIMYAFHLFGFIRLEFQEVTTLILEKQSQLVKSIYKILTFNRIHFQKLTLVERK